MAGTAAGIVTTAGTIIVTGAAGKSHRTQIGPLIAGLFYNCAGLHCVLGEIAHRAGVPDTWPAMGDVYFSPTPWRVAASQAALANNSATDGQRHAAVIAPLRALAHALERAS